MKSPRSINQRHKKKQKQQQNNRKKPENLEKQNKKNTKPKQSGKAEKKWTKPVNPLLDEIKRYHAKKRFSQNFLINADVLSTITDSLELTKDDHVIEIGSGTGFLTACLLAKAGKITAIEVERDMQRILKEKFSAEKHFTLVEKDVMKTDFRELTNGKRTKIVGNLPYSITSPILFYLVGELYQDTYPLRENIECLTVMVQKEVADRITAKPGEKAYNPLSIAIQWWFNAEKICEVPPRSFHPAPKVTSAVVKLTPRMEEKIEIPDYSLLHKLVKTAFHQKRKTLKNALCHQWVKHGQLKESDVLAMLEVADINPTIRAEKLSLEDFGRLTHAFYRNSGKN